MGWPARFRHWRARIDVALGAAARRIEHVGSTSVPGLPAQPIVDIQVSVIDHSDEGTYATALDVLGLQLRSRDAMHHYFRPFPGHVREFHVHVCNAGSEWEREHLLFRDYLRSHPDEADRYAQAKRDAVRYWADDGFAYTDAKSEVILDQAEAWAAEQHWRP